MGTELSAHEKVAAQLAGIVDQLRHAANFKMEQTFLLTTAARPWLFDISKMPAYQELCKLFPERVKLKQSSAGIELIVHA